MIAPSFTCETSIEPTGSTVGGNPGALMPTEVEAEIIGSVWKVEVAVGDAVEEGDALIIIESMKMEIPVESPRAGTIAEIRVGQGDSVEEGQTLVVLA
jgi:acetyl-CoA carboxylase biotin carboxyl carrier protein